MDLISKYPQRNHVTMRNEVKEFYYKDMKAEEEKRKKKESEEYNPFEEEDDLDGYLNDNAQKRMYEKFYKYFERNYKYEICPMNDSKDHFKYDDQYSKNISLSDKSDPMSSLNLQSKSNTNLSNKTKPANEVILETEIDKIPNFFPGEIIIKDKSSNFIRWISSIFQTINDLKIGDFANVINNKIFTK
jgi:hypothetical protein